MFSETITITLKQEKKRIDFVCAELFPEIASRSQWQKYGIFILTTQKTPSPSRTKVSRDQQWKISYDEIQNQLISKIIPWKIDLDIIAESDSWILINKPTNVSCHPSVSEKSDHTLINALVGHFGENFRENFSDEPDDAYRPGLIHRLDKTTSGLILVAKNVKALAYYQSIWHREVTKRYQAVVRGKPPEHSKIKARINRDLLNRTKMTISDDPEDRMAITLIDVLESCDRESLVMAEILTGRTHQIRVHLSSGGYPIKGDVIYGGEKADRIYLHSWEMCFPDYDNEKKSRKFISKLPQGFWAPEK